MTDCLLWFSCSWNDTLSKLRCVHGPKTSAEILGSHVGCRLCLKVMSLNILLYWVSQISIKQPHVIVTVTFPTDQN